jgi:hypothetical protein
MAAALCAMLAAAEVRAQAAASAEALFKAGKALADKRDYAGACPKFEASYELDAALGTLLNMADCHEKLGAIAKAWGEWTQGSDRARKKGEGARADLAQRHADALEPRLPRLKIVVQGSAPDLAVVRDGASVPAGMYGEAVPVDPGPHAIVVRRGEAILKRVEVTVQERGRETVAVDLDAIAKASPPKPSDEGATPPPPPPLSTAAQVRNGFQSAMIALGGISMAGAGGLLIGAIAIKSSENGANCASTAKVTYCNAKGLDDISLARALANAGQWMGIAGIAVLGTGIALAATAPKSAPAKPAKEGAAAARRVWVAPLVGGGTIGLVAGGAL